MEKNLVIVESPAKAKTIKKFLGKNYTVLSSYGHIRDLKKKNLGVDINNNFNPEYITLPDKIEVIKQLKKAVKSADIVWLASDEDREGEAIAWHLFTALKLKEKKSKRIVFHEITKNAILNAIKHPRNIDLNLVNAQQARRILDRIVGFELSPILWKKIMPSLSAGRVQSAAVRLIVEREQEINNFVERSFFKIHAQFYYPNNKRLIQSELNKQFETEKEAEMFLKAIENSIFIIENINVCFVKKSPPPPFTTSSLQQEAFKKIGYNVSQTMSIAQKLYESGLITYMRTDSVKLSSSTLNSSKKEIINRFGTKYLRIRQYSTKIKGAQEAHEAIHPTCMDSQIIKNKTVQEQKLYKLIWERTISSQMADVELEKTMLTIGINNVTDKFQVQNEVIKFDGFLRTYMENNIDKNIETLQSTIKLNAILNLIEVTASEHFSQHPPRYTEASLVCRLEKLGIGRPSTYAPTIYTIQKRGYVTKENKKKEKKSTTVLTLKNGTISKYIKPCKVSIDKNKLIPTDNGIIVNNFLIEYFPNILEYNFTANIEKEFDKIASGNLEWTKPLHKFYNLFHPMVDKISSIKMKYKVGERVLGSDKDGKPVSVKIGRFGPFIQIGSMEDDEKPRFAPLSKDQSIKNITLKDALLLFNFPRTIGLFGDKPVVVAIGRFGPYLKFNNTFISIPKNYDPHHITIKNAEKLITEKKERDKNKIIKIFANDKELKIINGHFGAYISYKKINYKIPQKIAPETISYSEAIQIIKKKSCKNKSLIGNKKKRVYN
ncbi:MAG: type I DNA topoisomerase [Bacteroidales bacterium OttesenSCG-928-I14]|jgi:DNA topoisomerase-1|nr:type I DNA topoisomerase [Bacteroidales bacterium OttesenSCG-928-I14]